MSDVIYFDNAATSWPKPPAVAERMSKFLLSEAANPGRAGHRMAVGAEKMLDKVRKTLTDFICGPAGGDHHRLIFAMNGTDALNIAMKGLLRHGDHVTDWADTGTTDATDAQGLCEACNHAKQAPDWHARSSPGPGHTVEMTTPTGHTYTSHAPPLVGLRRGAYQQLWEGHWARIS